VQLKECGVSELSDIVSDQPVPVTKSRWTSDKKALVLRVLILGAAIAGSVETIEGLRFAWDHGVSHDGLFETLAQEIWGVFPYAVLIGIAAFRVSKRSLLTLFVATLLCWFMSTIYFDLEDLGLAVLVIPFIQLTFILGALSVMFTFWLLRKRP
jgi:hypothetical protein